MFVHSGLGDTEGRNGSMDGSKENCDNNCDQSQSGMAVRQSSSLKTEWHQKQIIIFYTSSLSRSSPSPDRKNISPLPLFLMQIIVIFILSRYFGLMIPVALLLLGSFSSFVAVDHSYCYCWPSSFRAFVSVLTNMWMTMMLSSSSSTSSWSKKRVKMLLLFFSCDLNWF